MHSNIISGCIDKCLAQTIEFLFNQILESERRLQLSNLLKVFAIKYESTSFREQFSLKEYLQQFADTSDCTRNEEHQFDVEYYIDILHDVSLPEIEVSQMECLIYIAGYAVFSYS